MPSDAAPEITADAIVIGAGFAGAAAAALLARQGHRVSLVDPHLICPPTFKAEKLETHQVAHLDRLDLLSPFRGAVQSIPDITVSYGPRSTHVLDIQQYGASYQGMVNALRGALPETVQVIQGRALEVTPDPEAPAVRLRGGDVIRGRLVVLACGAATGPIRRLGISRDMIRARHSLAFGFDPIRPDGSPMPSTAINFYIDDPRSGMGYLTLFPFPDRLRANLYTWWHTQDPRAKAFLQAPRATLTRYFPWLTRVAGPLAVPGPIEIGHIDLYRAQDPQRPGVILIGDAFQSVCPSTGTGVSRSLTDAEVLADQIGPLIGRAPLTAEALDAFYGDVRKVEMDDYALNSAHYQRKVGLERTPRMELHRARLRWGRELSALTRRGRLSLGFKKNEGLGNTL